MAGTVICDYINSANVSGGFFGVGQTWQNVTASRSGGVTYTNTTGKPIMVLFNHSGVNITVTVSGLSTIVNQTNGLIGMSFIVPNGATYSSNTVVYNWFELR